MAMMYRGTNGPGSGYSMQGSFVDTDLDRQNLANTGALEQQKKQMESQLALQNNAARIQEQKLKSLLPMFGQYSGNGGFGGAPGGQNTQAPGITVGGVYSPDQLQTQVNAARAAGDQRAATEIGQQASMLGGRGMSARSPLMAALANQTNAANAANNASNETQLRTNAAEGNARQLLGSETARSQQWQQGNALEIERRRQLAQQNQAFLSMIAGLAG